MLAQNAAAVLRAHSRRFLNSAAHLIRPGRSGLEFSQHNTKYSRHPKAFPMVRTAPWCLIALIIVATVGCGGDDHSARHGSHHEGDCDKPPLTTGVRQIATPAWLWPRRPYDAFVGVEALR